MQSRDDGALEQRARVKAAVVVPMGIVAGKGETLQEIKANVPCDAHLYILIVLHIPNHVNKDG